MDILFNIVQTIMDMGAAILLPIVLFIVGVAFRMKPMEALKSGLYVGIGFMGVNLIISLLNEAIAPSVEYYQTLGTGFTVTDIPWPAIGAASWAGPYSAVAVVASLVLNVILVRLKVVKVLNVDIWNYIHMLIPAMVLYAFFESFWICFFFVLILSVWTCIVSYWCKDPWQEQFGLEGTVCSTLTFCGWDFWFLTFFNKIIDKIPGLNKVEIDLEKLNQKIGLIADPCMIGLLVGIILNIITFQSVPTIIVGAVQMSAVMVLLPRMVNVFMEGLAGIGSAASDYMFNTMGEDAEVMIGMDICLGLGDPCALTATVIMVPVTIGLAFILPINYFPVGCLTSICYWSVMPTAITKGNIFRTLLLMTIYLAYTMSVTAIWAPEVTAAVHAMGVTDVESCTYTAFSAPYGLFAAIMARYFA